MGTLEWKTIQIPSHYFLFRILCSLNDKWFSLIVSVLSSWSNEWFVTQYFFPVWVSHGELLKSFYEEVTNIFYLSIVSIIIVILLNIRYSNKNGRIKIYTNEEILYKNIWNARPGIFWRPSRTEKPNRTESEPTKAVYLCAVISS